MSARQNCLVCQIIDGKIPAKKIYEDDGILCVLDINGANAGHCFVIPKEHFPIIEQIPDTVFARMFTFANKLSSAIFEGLKVQGTNLFITNGIPAGQTVAHCILHVIPRMQGDGVSLDWQTRKLNEEEMSTVELKIKEQLTSVNIHEHAKSPRIRQQIPPAKTAAPSPSPAKSKKVSETAESFSGDYMKMVTKQLRRVP